MPILGHFFTIIIPFLTYFWQYLLVSKCILFLTSPKTSQKRCKYGYTKKKIKGVRCAVNIDYCVLDYGKRNDLLCAE